MMVDMQQLSIIEIILTVSATSSVRSRIAQIWFTHLFKNMIQVGSDYIQRCIPRTGCGICLSEIGPDKFLE